MFQPRKTSSQQRPANGLTRALCLVLGIAFAVPAFDPSTVSAKEICRRFSVQLKTVNGLTLVRKGRFDNAAAGAYMKFRGRGQILSVFIYDNGKTSVTDADVRANTDDSMGHIRSAAKRRGDRIVSEGPTKLWSAAGSAFLASYLRATYKKANALAYEFVGLSHNTRCMLKIRYTNALDRDKDAALRRYRKLVLEVHHAMR